MSRVSAVIRTAIALGLLFLAKSSHVAGLVSLLYVLYAILINLLAANQSPYANWEGLFWLDAVWVLLASALAPAEAALVALFLFFPILMLSLGWGLKRGAFLTLACVVTLVAVDLAAPSSPRSLSADTPLLVLVFLLLAYLAFDLAVLGGQLRARAAVMHGLASLMDPRLGRNGLLQKVLGELARHFKAERGLVVAPGPGTTTTIVEYADGYTSWFRAPQSTLAELPTLPGGLMLALNAYRRWYAMTIRYFAYDIATGKRTREFEPEMTAVANFLDCDSLISVPLHRRGRPWGRLYLGAHSRGFAVADLYLLRDLAAQLGSAPENAELLQQMIDDASAHERSQISRNLHDSAVQPYLGLKFGLEALVRRMPADSPLRADVERLAELANHEVMALRKLVRTLDRRGGVVDETLEPAVRRHAARFGHLFNLDVRVDFDCDESLSDELAAHVFHLVAEGLSNISRHSRSRQGAISIGCQDGRLKLRIANALEGESLPAPFTPRSLSERARELGGNAEVIIGQEETVVSISLPIRQPEASEFHVV